LNHNLIEYNIYSIV